MLNKEKHQLKMGRILRDIYSDTEVASSLGFKGGSCAYFFYGLPRFSVDLDFDLLEVKDTEQKWLFEKTKAILEKEGEIKDGYIKRSTVFFLLSYGEEDHNVKVEINIREPIKNLRKKYSLKNYLGISMVGADKEYLFAGKLSALTLRREVAPRDIYDIHYFAKKNWNIDAEAVMEITGKALRRQLADCIDIVETLKDNQIMRGLGELVDANEKTWIRDNLRKETSFMLKNYLSVIRRDNK